MPFAEITKVDASVPYNSTLDGFIGLQPSQNDASTGAESLNFMKALRQNNMIENEVFMIQHLKDGSMLIKFGGWDLTASDGPTKFLACNSQKEYTLVM